MHKTYVTFGQDHCHEIDGVVFDKDCVAVIESSGPEEGRRLAFNSFGPKFCFEYPEGHFDFTSLDRFFPRGLINLVSKGDLK